MIDFVDSGHPAEHSRTFNSTALKRENASDNLQTQSQEAASDLPLDNDSIYDLRQQSSLKLKLAWESIYDKFQDAHLQAQDEIYLGRRSVKGDRMRVIRDRGHLRSMPMKKLEFGCFHIDKAEVIGYKSEDDDVAECSASVVDRNSPSDQQQVDVDVRHTSALKPSQSSSSVKEDPDLIEFLQAEARRREACGAIEDSDEEVDVFGADSVINFAGSCWNERPKKIRRSETPEDDLEVYSLASMGWNVANKRSSPTSSSSPLRETDTLDSASFSSNAESALTPPTSVSSTPARLGYALEKAQKGENTPSRSPFLTKRESNTQSNSTKRKKARVLLPRWDQSPRPTYSDASSCQGPNKCSKSLCMLCGGFKKTASDSQSID